VGCLRVRSLEHLDLAGSPLWTGAGHGGAGPGRGRVRRIRVPSGAGEPDGILFEGLWAIYKNAFPASEQRAKEQLRREIAGGVEWAFVLLDEKGVAGLAIVHPLLVHRYGLLNYLAIRSGLRGRGFGTTFMNELLSTLSAHGIFRLVLEVDDPFGGFDRKQRLARVRFYQRLRGKLLALNYGIPSRAQPATAADAGKVDLKLMVLPADDMDVLPADDARLVVSRIFTSNYHCADAPVAKAVLEDLQSDVPLITFS
jgi:GNAT superfamily N-acetyltransferase